RTETLSAMRPSGEFLAQIPIAFARKWGVLGLEGDDGKLVVALGDFANREQVQIVSRALNRPAKILLAPPSVVLSSINDAYQQRMGEAQAMIETFSPELDRNAVLDEVQRLASREDLLDVASRAPVIK